MIEPGLPLPHSPPDSPAAAARAWQPGMRQRRSASVVEEGDGISKRRARNIAKLASCLRGWNAVTWAVYVGCLILYRLTVPPLDGVPAMPRRRAARDTLPRRAPGKGSLLGAR